MNTQKYLHARRIRPDIHACLKFLTIRSIRTIHIDIGITCHRNTCSGILQDRPDLLGNSKRDILLLYTVRSDRTRVASAMSRVQHDILAGDPRYAGITRCSRLLWLRRHDIDGQAVRLAGLPFRFHRIDLVVLLLHIRGQCKHYLDMTALQLTQCHVTSQMTIQRNILIEPADFRILQINDQLLCTQRIRCYRIVQTGMIHADLNMQSIPSIDFRLARLEIIQFMHSLTAGSKRNRSEQQKAKQAKARHAKKHFLQKKQPLSKAQKPSILLQIFQQGLSLCLRSFCFFRIIRNLDADIISFIQPFRQFIRRKDNLFFFIAYQQHCLILFKAIDDC